MILFDKFFAFPVNEDNLPRRREQVRARIALYPTMVLPAMVIALMLVVLMWNSVPQARLLQWLALVWAWHGIELLHWWRRRAEADTLAQCRAWHRRFMLHTAGAAALWGYGWWQLFVPGDLGYQALLVCVAVGMGAGALTTNAVHRPSLFAYLVLLLLPLIVRVALEGDLTHGLLAALLLLYLGFLFSAGLRMMQVFETSLRERFAKESLLGELRQREGALAEALQAAEQANRAKSKFLAAASHDLRQPLQALRLFSDALQHMVQEAEPKRLAGQIGKSVNALAEMFEDLLDVSRLDAGIIEPRWQHFELHDLFDRLYVDFEPMARAKGLELRLPWCDQAGEGQAEACHAVVYSDPFLLERMLRNLVSNAIRYTDRGRVEVRCTCRDNTIEIAVRDTGIGIRPEVLPHIFEEYYQVDNPHRDRRKGLGLGLAIVRRVEELLGYQVQVESTPGQGSTFRFTLQAGKRDELVRPFVITASRYDVAGKVVALVEDDEDIRGSLAEHMTGWGCRVFAADGAADLLRKLDLEAVRPDILVCDYRLPDDQTALDVMRELRAFWGELPVVVVTGDTGEEVLRAIRAAGATLLNKPVAPLRLRAEMYFAMQPPGAAGV